MNRKKSLRLLALGLALLLVWMGLPLSASAADTAPESVLAGMTTQQKVAQMLMPSFRYVADENGDTQSMDTVLPEVKALLGKYGFAGVALFAQNLGDNDKAAQFTDELQQANAGHPQLLLAVDQEGGKVTRLGHGTETPGNMALAATGDPENAAKAATVIGTEIQALGMNFDFAPVLDVNNNPENPIIGTRSFSDDPETVAEYGVAFMQALQETGAISTLKHFPGHGDTATDSHTGLPRIDKSYAQLKANELVPFQAAIDAGADAIMTAHIQYPQIETGTYVSKSTGEAVNLPATLSKTIITDILRDDMGFDGVVLTDALEMDAIAEHFDPMDAAKLAINAGVDILLMPVGSVAPQNVTELETYIADLTKLVEDGEISLAQVDAAVLRILKLKEKHGLLEEYKGIDASKAAAVGSKANHEIEWDIAKQAVTLVKAEDHSLPFVTGKEKIVVLTPYDNEQPAMEYAVNRARAEGKLAKGTTVEVYSIRNKSAEEARALAKGADHLIIVTELYGVSALSGSYYQMVDDLCDDLHAAGGDVSVISCELPYDASRLEKADNILLCYGSMGMTEDPLTATGSVAKYGPNLPAALYKMIAIGENVSGSLPVDLPLYEDGAYSETVAYDREMGLFYDSYEMFTDLKRATWYRDGVEYCLDFGLMDGVGGYRFDPQGTATRGMLTTILWRMAGAPENPGVTAYVDGEPGHWYSQALVWAGENHIANGYGLNRFGTFDPVTREQAAVMLYRYAKAEPVEGEMGLAGFRDAGQISSWAADAIRWAVKNGILSGRGNGILAPKGTATRAELATMLMRFAQLQG